MTERQTTGIAVAENEQQQQQNSTNKEFLLKPILKIHIPTTPYQPTTMPKQQPKTKRHDKSDLGENFVAPDGGWGWLVAIAAGIIMLVTVAMTQNFGIIFSEHMKAIQISNTALTTIINTSTSVAALTGLLNGPIFRRYTYRQVALFSALLIFLGLFFCSFADSFAYFIVAFSVTYGLGRGFCVSSTSLAVNTYFKQKRRNATAYQYGVAGLGPIFLPYFATFSKQQYGVQGTVWLFAGLALNCFPCALLFQPVQWHVKKPAVDVETLNKPKSEEEQEDDDIMPYSDPDTPILARANDGWFGSRTSLNRKRANSLDEPTKVSASEMRNLRRLSSKNVMKIRSFSLSHSIKEETDDDQEHEHKPHYDLQLKETNETQPLQPTKTTAELEQEEFEARKRLPFYKKIIIFFDLDLLRDITYVNLAIGLTLSNFVEINFAVLTPFILTDFGFDPQQTAFAMSLLGFCDLIMRFLLPTITSKITLSNKMFFIVGIIGLVVGRFCLSFIRDYHMILAIFLWLGFFKAFRTVFWSIIIPGYVPLKRLPAAAGLQLLISSLFSMTCGPLIGFIRDKTNYAFTINFMNFLCLIAIVLWGLENIYRSYQRKELHNNTTDVS